MTTLLSPIPDFVRNEIERRRTHISTTDPKSTDYLWMHGRTPWVKMQSNAVFVSTEKVANHPNANKAISRTLYAGWLNTSTLSPFSTIYGNDELKPRPGITDLTSTIKGHLGMLREVEVKFKAYTLSQLELLQDLFMVPGIGVLVEWGWSVPDATFRSIDLAKEPEGDGNRWLKNTIKKNIQDGGGSYDALFGLICNFNITFVDDGTWDCSTTIVGPGAMTVDVNLNSPSSALDKKLIAYIENQAKKHMASGPDANESPYAKVAQFYSIDPALSLVVSPAEQQAQKEAKAANVPEALTAQTNIFVTWEFIETTLNSFFETQEPINFAGKNFILSYVQNPTKADPLTPAVTHTKTPQKNPSDGIIPCASFNYDTHIWRSYSPTEVLIPNHPESLDIRNREWVKLPPNSVPRSFDIKKLPYGDLAAVWLNYNTVIKSAFQNSETIQEALNTILGRMNAAVGGLWNLQLMFNDEDYSSYRVVDFKNTYGLQNSPDPYKFDLNVKNSLIRETEVSMIIPNALKATVMISANAPAGVESAVTDRDKVGVFRGLSYGVKDRFAYAREAQLLASTPVITHAVANPEQDKKNELLKTARNKGWQIELSGDEKGAAINFIYDHLERRAESSNAISALIPLDLSITLDGIGGLTWGNAFTVSYLPQKYIDNAIFQIKDISHSVGQDGWTTKIVGQMRPRYRPVVTGASADLPKNVAENVNTDSAAYQIHQFSSPNWTSEGHIHGKITPPTQ